MDSTSPSRIFIGFDGFVDTLIHCVRRRTSPSRYQRLARLPLLAQKIQEASSRSANIECVPIAQSLGGNAPILAQALACLGHRSTLFGCCGFPQIHPLFLPLVEAGVLVHSFANPGRTDALEFTDGKLLLGRMEELNEITVESLTDRLGSGIFQKSLMESSVVATVNWTMTPIVDQFWDFLLRNTPLIDDKILFVDLADPAKRPKGDLRRALSRLSRLGRRARVILGLNRSESEQVLDVLGIPQIRSLKRRAAAIFEAIQPHCVVIHSASEAALKAHHTQIEFPIKPCRKPARSTGAGDIFNAGLISGIIEQHPYPTCLEMAAAAATEWVSTGCVLPRQSPSIAE